MTDSPMVSIITPTFQRMGFLPQALESALAQTFGDFELIVSDNGCSPAIADLVASYHDPRMQYRHNGGDIGPSLNAFAAARQARGRYLAFLHDDDAWEPDFLSTLVPPLEARPELVLAFSDHWIMGPDGVVDPLATERNTRRWRRKGLSEGVHRPFFREAVADRSVAACVAALIRRQAIGWLDLPTAVEPVYDLWLAYQACRSGAGAWYSPRRLTRYRVHEQSLTGQQRHDRAALVLYDMCMNDERLRPLRGRLRRVSAPFRTSVGIRLLEEGRTVEANRELAKGLLGMPEPRGLAALALSILPNRFTKLVSASRRLRHRLRGLSTDS